MMRRTFYMHGECQRLHFTLGEVRKCAGRWVHDTRTVIMEEVHETYVAGQDASGRDVDASVRDVDTGVVADIGVAIDAVTRNYREGLMTKRTYLDQIAALLLKGTEEE